MSDVTTDPFRRRYEDDDSDWGGHSGAGSLPFWTIGYRAMLENFIAMNEIKSIVDLGCGDWQFSKFMNLEGVRYHGFDVVESVVSRNRTLYAKPNISFDLRPDDPGLLPQADLLIMKDVLQHLPDEQIAFHKDHVFSRYPRCLITNSFKKIDTVTNININYGEFRCLDLNKDPYKFDGTYIFEMYSPLWEQIRTLLYRPAEIG